MVVILILMPLVGGVFIVTPSKILSSMTDIPYMWWVGIVIVYYFVATIMPVDKIIGKIYPIFGLCAYLYGTGDVWRDTLWGL